MSEMQKKQQGLLEKGERMSEMLKLCPRCGGTAELMWTWSHGVKVYFVGCTELKCDCEGQGSTSKKKAVMLWNADNEFRRAEAEEYEFLNQ